MRGALAELGCTIAELVRGPLERVSWALRRHLLWPLEDRLGSSGRRLPMVGFVLALTLAAALGVGGLLWASPSGSSKPTAAIETAAMRPQPAAAPRAKPQPAPAPTLHGASPVFAPPKALPGGVSSSRQLGAIASRHHRRAAAAGQTDEASAASSPAATEIVSSRRGANATASAAARSTQGRPAGPAALAVAREFADAFVLYETGQGANRVRQAFSKTTTLELRHALLRRPPRQPARVKVPRARVLNVVAAPSSGQVYPVSVSLLRVGLTSELRLSMEERKGKRWLVTDVLG